jgi:NAD(P)-dependent dehydrogenase (short-subunit alcohol dehydrogenase family)
LQPVLLDVLEQSTVDALRERVQGLVADGHRLHALVNNAGVAVLAPLEAVGAEALQRQFGVNAVGVNLMIQAMLPFLRQAHGRILNVGSPAGVTRPPFLGPYAASKAALEALTDVWRRELEGTGVHVVMVVPGAVMTPVWDKMAESADRLMARAGDRVVERHRARLTRFVRLNEQTAAHSTLSPDDVAQAVLAILDSDKPRRRYELGRGTTLAGIAGRVLPGAVLDSVFRRVLPTSGEVGS